MYNQHLISMLTVRKNGLSKLKKQLTEAIASYPEGHINASVHISTKNKFTYLFVDKNGRRSYIKKGSDQLIKGLVQKDYDIQAVRRIDKEIKLIDQYLDYLLHHNSPEDLYPSLPLARKVMVTPFAYPDDEYVSLWKAQPYTGKPFPENSPEHYSENGLRVRSKSEEAIANVLDRMNIPYKYECPVNLSGWGTSILILPCFMLRKEKRCSGNISE